MRAAVRAATTTLTTKKPLTTTMTTTTKEEVEEAATATIIEMKKTKINLLFPLTFHPFATTTLRLASPHPLIPSLSPPGLSWAWTTLM